MRTLSILALLTTATMAEAQTHTPRGQAVLFIAPEGVRCPPCPVLIADLKSLKGCAVATEDNPHVAIVNGREVYPHFVVRRGVPGMSVPTMIIFDDDGKAIAKHVGYRCFKGGELLPYEDRLNELRRIMRKHPMFRPSKPPAAPPVDDNLVASVVSRGAPVRTAELVTMGDAVEVDKLSTSTQIKTVQYIPFSSDCSGSQAFAMPYSDCSGGGGIGGGGGGDFFTPPAQSVYAQYAQQQYANPYAARPYTMAYAPRYSPYAANGGGNFNNYSLFSVPIVRPSFSVFGLGGLLGQRSYYAPRRLQYRSIAPSPLLYASYSRPVPYRQTYRAVSRSPFSYVSYVGSGSRMVCGPNGCVMY